MWVVFRYVGHQQVRNNDRCKGIQTFLNFMRFCGKFDEIVYCIGGSKGGGRESPPPKGGPNSFIFMQFLAKKLQNNRFLGVGAPPGQNTGSATVLAPPVGLAPLLRGLLAVTDQVTE